MSKNRLKTVSILFGCSLFTVFLTSYAYSPLSKWPGGSDGSWGWGGDNIELPLAIYNNTGSNVVLTLGGNSCTDNTASRFSTSPPPGGSGTTAIPPGHYWSAYLGFNSGDGCSLASSTPYMYLNMYVQSSSGLKNIGWIEAQITSSSAAQVGTAFGFSADVHGRGIRITSGNMKNGYTVKNDSYDSGNPYYAVAVINPPS